MMNTTPRRMLSRLCSDISPPPSPERPVAIWCPFDTERSLYVQIFRAFGYDVTATHINDGDDFFTTEPPACDYIISNPPYSLKGEVLERLFDLGIPFAMLVGAVGLFESQRRFNMFRANPFEIMYFNRRVSYFKNYDTPEPTHPPFSSVYVCSGVLPKTIVFEEITKR